MTKKMCALLLKSTNSITSNLGTKRKLFFSKKLCNYFLPLAKGSIEICNVKALFIFKKVCINFTQCVDQDPATVCH